MKKYCLCVALALVLPLVAKCQYYNYAPNTLNIPLLTQKGDATFRIGWGRGSTFQALELQGVYSPLPHLAVMSNYFGAQVKNVREMRNQGTDSYFWEAGLGTYEQFPKGAASLFVGYGTGRLFSNFQPDVSDLNSTLHIQRWFVQPGLAYRSNAFQAALALRLTRLVYNRGKVAYSIDQYNLNFIQNIEKESPIFLPEIGLQAGIRFNPVTVGVSITTIFPSTDHLNFARLNANLSIAVDLGVGKKAPKTTDK